MQRLLYQSNYYNCAYMARPQHFCCMNKVRVVGVNGTKTAYSLKYNYNRVILNDQY